jgi:hypothetical protein
MKSFFFSLLITFLFATQGCMKGDLPAIENFQALTNLAFAESDTALLTMDLSDAIVEGIIIPNNRQTANGYLNFSFDALNNDQALFYKIFYQNESYKFEEGTGDLDEENFYGSWEDVAINFKPILFNGSSKLAVKDSLRIVGNPRMEKKYFGAPMEQYELHDENVEAIVERIRANPDWLNGVKEKAEKEKRNLDLQLYLDALWVISYERQKGEINHRWKRNPRAGIYKFMLVVATEDALKTIPSEIQNIGMTSSEGKFLNPFAYFSSVEAINIPGINVFTSDKFLKLNARLDPGTGVYVDLLKAGNPNLDKSYYNDNCNESWEVFRKAHFAQYYHYINKNYTLSNIPVIADVVGDPYSKEEYFANVEKFKEVDLIFGYPNNTECPCKTVISNRDSGYIELRNPGNSDISKAKKENVGIIGRIGFTYGKFTAKIDFPKQINETNVWNGVTNAFWMIYQDEYDWNQRRVCDKVGYIPKDKTWKDDIRVPVLNYSEIDFEIIKASKYWTWSSYPKDRPYPQQDASALDEIIVACTNWDLACNSPSDFSWGVFDVDFQDTSVVFHRWDRYYKAVTSKYAIQESKITSHDHYYYQIDWQPNRITWRIGPEKNRLKTIAGIDTRHTSIPNNQMVVVVTQEFHFADWWPTAPFKQDYIPYPKNDIVGRVLEITIE